MFVRLWAGPVVHRPGDLPTEVLLGRQHHPRRRRRKDLEVDGLGLPAGLLPGRRRRSRSSEIGLGPTASTLERRQLRREGIDVPGEGLPEPPQGLLLPFQDVDLGFHDRRPAGEGDELLEGGRRVLAGGPEGPEPLLGLGASGLVAGGFGAGLVDEELDLGELAVEGRQLVPGGRHGCGGTAVGGLDSTRRGLLAGPGRLTGSRRLTGPPDLEGLLGHRRLLVVRRLQPQRRASLNPRASGSSPAASRRRRPGSGR
ncbi:MAG: hypothetical protein KatS3mg065_0864 [Chloroflexota bacterium]|nr:MAG: hypothetical protein KatS3mg065_0864 [Chloroflexota bacterium]